MKSNLTIVGFGIVGAMIADTLSDYIDDITIIYKYDDKKNMLQSHINLCFLRYLGIFTAFWNYINY